MQLCSQGKSRGTEGKWGQNTDLDKKAPRMSFFFFFFPLTDRQLQWKAEGRRYPKLARNVSFLCRFLLPDALSLSSPPLSLAISLSLPSQTQLPLLIHLLPFKDGRSVTQRRGGEEAAGVRSMQSRASVAKVGRLRWGVSTARAHWCMNAAKSNASLDRQEGGRKGESGAPRESSCTSASRCYQPFLSLPPSLFLFCLSSFFMLLSSALFIYFPVFLHLQLSVAAASLVAAWRPRP